MQIFTQEDVRPSEKTLQLIRQIAYSYQALNNKDNHKVYCLN